MKQIVKYTGTKSERMQKALSDCKSYLGQELYDNVMSLLLECIRESGVKSLVSTYKFNLMTIGIEGAPARALMLQALRETKG